MNKIIGLDVKNVNLEHYVQDLLINKAMLSNNLNGLVSKHQIYQENCFNVLKIISEKNPGFLYPHWDFFVNHLHSANNYHKTGAIIIITNLTKIDNENKFEAIFNQFFDNLKSNKTIAPMYLIKNSAKIIKSKPHLENKITNLFLEIDYIHQGKQIELVKSAVIETFSGYLNISNNKTGIISFVTEQLNSISLKTRKLAKEFLTKNVVN